MRILLVEDNFLNQKVVGFYLKRFNHTLDCASNWVEALEAFQSKVPDLILMDIMLPGKNGFEITAEIRDLERQSGRNSGVPIVALTANTLDNGEEKCLQAGMNGYLSKPFSAEELNAAIEKYGEQGK